MNPHAQTLNRKQQRDAARRLREREQAEREVQSRRRRRIKLLVATAAVAILIAAGAIALSIGSNSTSTVTNASRITAQLAGIPQADMTLGNAKATVTISEYGDLQCVACAAFATSTLPSVIDKIVRSGAAKLSFHNWTIIDQTDSVRAAEASYAAARQGRAWQFIDLFYVNQGTERSGYVTTAFLDRLAKAAGLDVSRFDQDRVSPAIRARVAQDARQAAAYRFQGTPSFAVSGPHGTRVLAPGAPSSIQPFEEAIQAVR